MQILKDNGTSGGRLFFFEVDMRWYKFILVALLLTVGLSACSRKNDLVFPIEHTNIKYALGDNMDWASPSADTDNWSNLESSNLKIDKTKYFWIKINEVVPEELQENGNLYFALGKMEAVCEIFVNGSYIGRRGSLPPRVRLNLGYFDTFIVPQALIQQGSISIALRCYAIQNEVSHLLFYLYNKDKAYFEGTIRNMFNSSLFLVISFISAFIMFYCFFAFLDVRRESAFLYFGLSLFFIIIYFLDIATENIPLPYAFRRGFARACMPISVYFLGLFINAFYLHKYKKSLTLFTFISSLVGICLFLSFFYSLFITELLFKIFLLPAVGFIVYGIASSIIGIKRKIPYSINIFIGFSIGGALAFHDVIYQILEKDPFSWLQGVGIFILDISIFAALILRSSKAQQMLLSMSQRAEAQHKKLGDIFKNAQKMSIQTVQIANELARSVRTVMQSARISRDKVSVINQAIHKQSSINSQTADTIKAMTGSFSSMNKEFDKTTQSIHMTANSTKSIMEGIVKVNFGIMTAENFSRSLNSITQTGSDDMKKLFSVIEQIQNSSREILSVASTLDDFAQQTDLLSMNAAIEAAHTGEAGKGFAVIAHEIKKLAANSSSYAIRIGDIVTNVIGYIQDSVKLTEKVNQTFIQIQEGASQSVEKVLAASKGIKEQMEISQSISRDAEAMAESATRMKETVMKQSAYSSSVLANMEQLIQASMKVDRSSNDISHEAQNLAEQVRALSILADKTHQTAEQLEQLMDLA